MGSVFKASHSQNILGALSLDVWQATLEKINTLLSVHTLMVRFQKKMAWFAKGCGGRQHHFRVTHQGISRWFAAVGQTVTVGYRSPSTDCRQIVVHKYNAKRSIYAEMTSSSGDITDAHNLPSMMPLCFCFAIHSQNGAKNNE